MWTLVVPYLMVGLNRTQNVHGRPSLHRMLGGFSGSDIAAAVGVVVAFLVVIDTAATTVDTVATNATAATIAMLRMLPQTVPWFLTMFCDPPRMVKKACSMSFGEPCLVSLPPQELHGGCAQKCPGK